MSAQEEEVQKYLFTFQFSYQNKSCSECQQDVRKIERQADRWTDRHIERQIDFSAYLSKQQLFRMSTGCQKVSQTDRKIYSAPGRQTERQNDCMAE